ncbi:Hypothetical_protein [Hexamita inflata]|uniref:Hypothetical_protein n=1 Tax=Hexamita inflata TaxID=28002 RepID=A0ABP1HLU1_9EUKA
MLYLYLSCQVASMDVSVYKFLARIDEQCFYYSNYQIYYKQCVSNINTDILSAQQSALNYVLQLPETQQTVFGAKIDYVLSWPVYVSPVSFYLRVSDFQFYNISLSQQNLITGFPISMHKQHLVYCQNNVQIIDGIQSQAVPCLQGVYGFESGIVQIVNQMAVFNFTLKVPFDEILMINQNTIILRKKGVLKIFDLNKGFIQQYVENKKFLQQIVQIQLRTQFGDVHENIKEMHASSVKNNKIHAKIILILYFVLNALYLWIN